MFRSFFSVLRTRGWLILVGIGLGLAARMVLGPPPVTPQWGFPTEMPENRPDDDLPLILRKNPDSVQ